jgi:hypothetical protein
MEQQGIFDLHLPTTANEAKWAMLQARTTPEEKQEIQICCKWLGLNYSVVTRIVWRILIQRMREMPQVKGEITSEISGAVDQFEVHLPIFKRQKQIAPKMF